MVGHYVEMAIVFSFNSCYGFQLSRGKVPEPGGNIG